MSSRWFPHLFFVHPSRQFLVYSLAFLVGVAFASFGQRALVSSAAVVAAAMLIVSWRFPRSVTVAIVAAFTCILGMIRFEQWMPPLPAVSTPVSVVRGVAVSEPAVRDAQQSSLLSTASGRLALTVRARPRLAYGDEVLVRCSVEPLAMADGYSRRLVAVDRAVGRCDSRESFSVVATGRANRLVGALIGVRRAFVASINQMLPEPESSFLSGLLVGERSSLPEAMAEAFRLTGTTHIIALSGFNITVMAAAVFALTRQALPRPRAMLLCLAVITLFVVATGASASVTRAGIMGSLVLVSQMAGRLAARANLLVAACLVMVAVTPGALVFDVSFQLSVAATAGLLVIAPTIVRRLWWLPSRFGLRETAAATIAATVATLPLTVGYFGRVSLVSPVVNLLVVPLVPLVMLMGFGATAAGSVAGPLGPVVALPAWLGLFAIEWVVTAFAELPAAAVALTGTGTAVVVMASLLLTLVVLRWSWRSYAQQ